MSNQTARTARSRSSSHLSSGARAVALGLAASLLGACAQGEPTEHADEAIDASAAGRFAGIPQQGNTLGAESAPVTLEEFSDLRCSHCRDFADHTLPVLVDRYVRAGRLRIVFHNLPILGTPSTEAARMAAAIGLQGHQFEFVELFFHRPHGPVTDDVLRHLASQVPGVDVEAAMKERSSAAVDTALADARTLARRFSVEGTPTFLLGKTGTAPHAVADVRPNQPETLTRPIDELLAQR